jgi:excisionase family DNA binding protein
MEHTRRKLGTNQDPRSTHPERNRPATELRTVPEIAERFAVSTRTIRRLIKSGALRVHRIGRLVRISETDAEDFLANQRSY